MKFGKIGAILTLLSVFFITSCMEEPKKVEVREDLLTLADVAGRTAYKENTPGIRVIDVKAKAFIKGGDIRGAKNKALETASLMAVDDMVRELLQPEEYNRNYEKIEQYMAKSVDKYIVAKEVIGGRKIFDDKFYGIKASFKINRQQVLVALQKDLKIISKSGSTLIPIVTSKKGINLRSVGMKFKDIEDALIDQLQTDLNTRGLVAMDWRNAIVSMQTDAKKKKLYGNITKEQFMAMISGSKPSDVALNKHVANAEEFYSQGLTLLKQLAKVTVEMNIMSVSGNRAGAITMTVRLTARNISTGTGGAFANKIITVVRQGGPNVVMSAMLAGLTTDTFEAMDKEFIPQVIKEMSTVEIGGKKLVAYELVMKGFTKRDARKMQKVIKGLESEEFRFIDRDNTIPGMVRYFIRTSEKASALSDKVIEALEDAGYNSEEPITGPGLRDVVFVKAENPKE